MEIAYKDIMCHVLSNSGLKYIITYSFYYIGGQFYNYKKIEIKSAIRQYIYNKYIQKTWNIRIL